MKKLQYFFIVFVWLFSSCGSLLPVSVSSPDALAGYRYVYVNPTGDRNSVTGGTFGGQYAVYGATRTTTTNASDVISGYLMKKGFVIVDKVPEDQSKKCVIVTFGESGRRNFKLGYTIEVTLQFLDGVTREPICVATGEGQGSTEADDIRIAITRCLDAVLGTSNQQ